MEANKQLLVIGEIEQRYTDWIGPLMPYCIKLTNELIMFKLPMHLLSGDGNEVLLRQLFNKFEMRNDIREVHRTLDSDKGYAEMELGDWKIITLYFRYSLRIEYITKLLSQMG